MPIVYVPVYIPEGAPTGQLAYSPHVTRPVGAVTPRTPLRTTQRTPRHTPRRTPVDQYATARYKTQLCRWHMSGGGCRYGARCHYAHGVQELKTPLDNPRYKQQPCVNYQSTGRCPYGARCQFYHTEVERRPATNDIGSSSDSSSPGSSFTRELPTVNLTTASDPHDTFLPPLTSSPQDHLQLPGQHDSLDTGVYTMTPSDHLVPSRQSRDTKEDNTSGNISLSSVMQDLAGRLDKMMSSDESNLNDS